MDYNKQEELEAKKGDILTSALVGTAMALIIMGMAFESYGYTFGTIAPSVLLIFCLWWPFFQSKNYFLRKNNNGTM